MESIPSLGRGYRNRWGWRHAARMTECNADIKYDEGEKRIRALQRTQHQIAHQAGKLMLRILCFSAVSLALWQIITPAGKAARSDISSQQLFIAKWERHAMSHPIQASDRIGFAEMGLRTRMYARLLNSQKFNFIDSFESRLWPFVSGAKKLRLGSLGLQERDKYSSQHSSGTGRRSLESFTPYEGLTGSQWRGPGIVMSVGRSEVRYALHFLEILRKVHMSTLPVELYHYGEDDLPAHMRTLLETLYDGVRTIDLERTNLFDPIQARLSRQGWALKPFALLATNFSQVILADADVIFLLEPSKLLEVKGYQKSGTLFFHDRDHSRIGADTIVHEFIQEQLGAHGPSEGLKDSHFWIKKGIYQQESGVVVIDKKRREAFSALFLAAWQNIGGIREKTTYRIFWGEKESYWLAFELAGFPYYFVDQYAGGFGNPEPFNGQFCSDHLLHFIPHDSLNKSNSKKRPGSAAWFNGSLLQNKLLNQTVYLTESSWAVDGKWTFDEDTERWCLPESVYSGTANDLLDNPQVLVDISQAALDADRNFEALKSMV